MSGSVNRRFLFGTCPCATSSRRRPRFLRVPLAFLPYSTLQYNHTAMAAPLALFTALHTSSSACGTQYTPALRALTEADDALAALLGAAVCAALAHPRPREPRRPRAIEAPGGRALLFALPADAAFSAAAIAGNAADPADGGMPVPDFLARVCALVSDGGAGTAFVVRILCSPGGRCALNNRRRRGR
jgi:hypothetical protein